MEANVNTNQTENTENKDGKSVFNTVRESLVNTVGKLTSFSSNGACYLLGSAMKFSNDYSDKIMEKAANDKMTVLDYVGDVANNIGRGTVRLMYGAGSAVKNVGGKIWNSEVLTKIREKMINKFSSIGTQLNDPENKKEGFKGFMQAIGRTVYSVGHGVELGIKEGGRGISEGLQENAKTNEYGKFRDQLNRLLGKEKKEEQKSQEEILEGMKYQPGQ